MSDPENFIARWSRLKRETGKESADELPPPSPPAAPQERGDPIESPEEQPGSGSGQPPAFDPNSLPPIESITAGSDIRAFLEKNVPAHLTRAALRRAWTADPAIRDFIGIAENQWDFTAPNAMPGFGPLAPTDDVGKLVAQAMGKFGEMGEQAPPNGAPPVEQLQPPPATGVAAPGDGAQPQAVGMPEQLQRDAEQGPAVETQHSAEIAAPQHASVSAESFLARSGRGHGGALPK